MREFDVEQSYGAHGVWKPRWEAGAEVQIVDRQTLEEFRESWKYVARPTDEQLAYAGIRTKVRMPTFYHGGYVIYVLEDAPGGWLSPTIFAVDQL